MDELLGGVFLFVVWFWWFFFFFNGLCQTCYDTTCVFTKGNSESSFWCVSVNFLFRLLVYHMSINDKIFWSFKDFTNKKRTQS